MVYQALIQAFVDIRNLSELLSQAPDVKDSPTALDLPLPIINRSLQSPKIISEPSIALHSHGVSVEFRNISFHYPGQPVERGLKNVSFFVRPGSTTAIVGHTGAGE